MKTRLLFYLLLFSVPCRIFAQGSWNPTGFDPSYPRTLLDSTAIPVIRASLDNPDHLTLYGNTWLNANSAIPPGNSTIEERSARAMIARDAAFVYLMDRKFSANTIIPLSQGARDSLLTRVLGLLAQMNTDVDVGSGWTFYNPWQHRSKELISFLIAHDLLKGAGVAQTLLETSKSNILTFTANLYQKSMATYVVYLFFTMKFFTFQVNNHSIMTASALGLAAVVFNDYSSTNVNYQPQNWINAGLYNLDNTLWRENGTYPRVSEPDTLAGYAEGPNYFKYAFENAFPFIRSMGNFLPDGNYSATFNNTTRSIRNPWFDPRYDRLYDWMNKIRLPDGSCPAIHDCAMFFGTGIMALSGKPQFNWPNPVYPPDDPAIRTQYIATNVTHAAIADSPFQSLPAAGSLVFRSSWEPSAVYMHFIGKHGIALTGAKAHHQGDATAFSLMAYGELLAIDPGYPGASVAEIENKAIDHSLILVNGTGPLPPTGESVSTSTNTAYIEHSFDTPFLDYGEVRVSYQGADIIRKNLFVRNKYFLLSDFVSSATAKNFTFQLHGNGLYGGTPASLTGAFVPGFSNGRGTYTRNEVSLLAQVNVPGNASGYSYEQDSMAIFGSYRKYSKILVQKNNTTGTLFLSTLFPYTTPPPDVAQASQSTAATSVRILADNSRDLIFCSPGGILYTVSADSSGLNIPVKGNGKINFLSETTDGIFTSAFLQNGDSLVAGTQTIIRTGKKTDVAWMKIDSDLSGGYVSDFGTIQLFSGRAVQLLTGPVSAISNDTVNHLAAVTFTGKGNFIFGPADLTWVWNGQANEDWHNPANWHMLNHTSFSGVPVATNNVIIPSGVPHMPVISSVNPAICHNLTIRPEASLTVGSLKFLTIEGTMTIEDNLP
ncbi:MAG: heparinase II/III family protein [Bacteroidetes bacterium]|nr:heparinase II/III family protein [Bacteroidota bacterium]